MTAPDDQFSERLTDWEPRLAVDRLCATGADDNPVPGCGCRRCLDDSGAKTGAGIPITATRMTLCRRCGNKRCPHATDHRNACTDSNEPGQAGSVYR